MSLISNFVEPIISACMLQEVNYVGSPRLVWPTCVSDPIADDLTVGPLGVVGTMVTDSAGMALISSDYAGFYLVYLCDVVDVGRVSDGFSCYLVRFSGGLVVAELGSW